MRIKTLNGTLPEVLKAPGWKKTSDGKGKQFTGKEGTDNLLLTEKHCITVKKTLH